MRRTVLFLLLIALVAHPFAHLLDEGSLPCAGGRDVAVESVSPTLIAAAIVVAAPAVADELFAPAPVGNEAPARAPPVHLV